LRFHGSFWDGKKEYKQNKKEAVQSGLL